MPINKLITMLGTVGYDLATYHLAEKAEDVETRFFSVAVTQWFKPEAVYVLLTDQARNHENWRCCREELEQRLPAKSIHEVLIPAGKSEKELWQIFEAIEGTMSPGDTIIFDVTHGFRSLPILSLLAIAYLRQVKGVKVERVVYGAYEAKDEQKVVPVFDLTPFVGLLDWLTAAKIFMSTGDGRELAGLMESVQNQAFRSSAPNPPKQLKSLARWVHEVSQNLLLNRASQLAHSVQELQEQLSQPSLKNEVRKWLPPLVPLFSQIQQQYAPFAQDDLHTQLKVIEWYATHGHLVQAYTLAREWLVNYELRRQGKWDARADRNTRESVERDLHQAAMSTRAGDSSHNADRIAKLWDELTDYRNDIAHCGFRESPIPAATLRDKLGRIIEQLKSLLDTEVTS